MSNGNNQNRLDLLDTTKRVPNGLTRSRPRSHGATGIPIHLPDDRSGPEMYTNRILGRNGAITTYKPSNMNKTHSQSRVFGKAPTTAPRRRGFMIPANPNSSDVITIEDERPKRRVTDSMNTKEPSRRSDDDNSHKKNKKRIYQNEQQHRSTAENNDSSSRRNKSRVIKDDEDEAVGAGSKSWYNRLHERLGTIPTFNHVGAVTSMDDEDKTKGKGKYDASAVTKDVFDLNSVEETTARRKRTPGGQEGSQRQYGKQRDQKEHNAVRKLRSTAAKAGGSSSRGIRVDEGEDEEKEQNDDEEDIWENQVAKKQGDEGRSLKRRRLRASNNKDDDDKDDFHDPGSSSEAAEPESIPQLMIPKRRRGKGIVFHSDPDDIPVDPDKSSNILNSNKSSTSRFRTDLLPNTRRSSTAAFGGLTARVTRSTTRSATHAFQTMSNNVRGILGQPQYITIDDDDSDVEIQQQTSPRRSGPRGQQVLFHYPSSAPGSVTVVREDANRLMDGQMLNDSIIDFYVKWLLTNSTELPSADQSITERVHVFNTFFFARLKQSTK
ncbi:hypothetical protein BDB00DRAFT_181219 [Zychaea mexicana]|uniref:uncharacterized protein n=1 Tax=Zychaea mexicana TaxID=64656 RepID=UPI0022FE40B6|nr:uncharacterized protein BDB00DRAFT_181219 [Zychaea mexicana]KAI9496022.1 hypothetical protein BDB00DRAFT_181219 [Zychaea mexicana]